MNKSFLRWWLAAALGLGALAAGRTWAAEAAANLSAPGRVWQHLAQKLDLTAEQRREIRRIIAAEKDTLQPEAAALHAARKELRAAIQASDATEASVRAASAKTAAAEADLAVERLKLYGRIAPILTDAQRKQLAELQAHLDGLVDSGLARIGSGPGDKRE